MIRSPARLLGVVLLLVLTAPAQAAANAEPKPETRGLYLQLISQARADGRSRAALAYLDDFDRQYPGDVEAQVLRINCLLDLDEIDKAEAVAATMSVNDNMGRLDAVRGHLLAARGHWNEAVPFYRTALRARPTDALLRNALGYAQLRAGQPAAAVETLRAAADLAPGETVIRNNLALAFMLNNQSAQAAAILDASVEPQARDQLSTQITAEAARIKALAGPSAHRGD